MSFEVPFLTPRDDESWKQLEVGDRARVKSNHAFLPGATGLLVDIDKETESYTLFFSQILTYDGDDLHLAKKRPADSPEQIMMKSEDVAPFIFMWQGQLYKSETILKELGQKVLFACKLTDEEAKVILRMMVHLPLKGE